MIEKLSDDEIASALHDLEGWERHEVRHAICKTFKFKDFNIAWGFMTRCAFLAEKMNHHPEWSNVYGRVEVLLTTHDANGVSQRDIDMAQEMNDYAAGF